MTTRRAVDWRSALTLAVLVGILAGCALSAKQRAAVGQFGDSATTFGDVTSSELKAMRDDTIKMTTARLLLGGRSSDPNLGDPTTLDRGFELKRVETVSGATRGLAAYGKSLAALVDDTQSAQLKAASNEFVASLGRVPAAREKLSDKQLEAIGTAVQEVGGLWVEWKRKQALTTIVKATRGAVDQLCDLLARDFDPRTGWVAQQLLVIEAPLVGQASDALAGARTYNDRKTVMDAFRLAQSSRMRRTEVVARVSEAAKAMKKANDALAQAVEDSAWSTQDIQSFAERARSLQTAVTTIVSD
ncbi:MAG: hypothetical protein DMD87_23230 [Candidatus Rokuibacteriota bacterium]|nr:MAG: hypothetical protein DMD87_23230 [Candidatus Rokubacteria bacterium]